MSPIRALFIWSPLRSGFISAAARVALSRIAETEFAQKRPSGGIWMTYWKTRGLNPSPRKIRPIIKMYTFSARIPTWGNVSLLTWHSSDSSGKPLRWYMRTPIMPNAMTPGMI